MHGEIDLEAELFEGTQEDERCIYLPRVAEVESSPDASLRENETPMKFRELNQCKCMRVGESVHIRVGAHTVCMWYANATTGHQAAVVTEANVLKGRVSEKLGKRQAQTREAELQVIAGVGVGGGIMSLVADELPSQAGTHRGYTELRGNKEERVYG
jgi:hypothetical protein